MYSLIAIQKSYSLQFSLQFTWKGIWPSWPQSWVRHCGHFPPNLKSSSNRLPNFSSMFLTGLQVPSGQSYHISEILCLIYQVLLKIVKVFPNKIKFQKLKKNKTNQLKPPGPQIRINFIQIILKNAMEFYLVAELWYFKYIQEFGFSSTAFPMATKKSY